MRFFSVITCLVLLAPALIDAQRFVGYYGKTADDGCPDYPSFDPAKLPVELYTHLNFAFVMINSQGVVELHEPSDADMIKRLNALKEKKPSLKTAVTVGGWDMDMAMYSKMVSTPANRAKFIKSALDFVRQYQVDGLDFDWEYPADPRRGGTPQDPENFVTFMREMREAADKETTANKKDRLILSIALPGGPYHGVHFLIPKLAQYVDWFNIMAYNLHGQWEDMVFCAAPLYDPARDTKYNGYSVYDAAISMAPKSVNPRKFNMGLSLSAVTFTLKDKTKTTPGSPAIGPGREGCQEKGAMAYFEAKKLANNLQIAAASRKTFDHLNREVTQEPRLDEVGKCMYMVVDGDQWVGFDNPDTFKLKIDFVKQYGFGGVSLWSMDSDTPNHELITSIHTNLAKDFVQLNDTQSTNPSAANGNSKDGKQSKSGNSEGGPGNDKSVSSSAVRSKALEVANFAIKVMATVALGIFVFA
ncbi:hypothetical protein BGW41_007333 [Actinomortierella wolfii]|nr:hypothetical protein BGW41_007333 [Actinomortierella wolfii]